MSGTMAASLYAATATAIDDDTKDDTAASLSPASTTTTATTTSATVASPRFLLSLPEPTFTPLSIDSDSLPGPIEDLAFTPAGNSSAGKRISIGKPQPLFQSALTPSDGTGDGGEVAATAQSPSPNRVAAMSRPVQLRRPQPLRRQRERCAEPWRDAGQLSPMSLSPQDEYFTTSNRSIGDNASRRIDRTRDDGDAYDDADRQETTSLLLQRSPRVSEEKQRRNAPRQDEAVGLISPAARDAAATRGCICSSHSSPRACPPPPSPLAPSTTSQSQIPNPRPSDTLLLNRNFPELSTLSTRSPAPAAATDAEAASSTASSRSSSSPTSSSSLRSQLQEHLERQAHADDRHHHHDTPVSAAVGKAPARPIIRTTSDSFSLTVRHPAPDLNTRSGAYAGNIAQLEATAERLSMTSSIEDAIRDLHGELKRSDSRRSSILAASVRAVSTTSSSDNNSSSNNINDYTNNSSPTGSLVIQPSFPRHLSATSIVDLNNAARHGGYSPGGYVMSPNHSLTSRKRSGSKTSTSRAAEVEQQQDYFLSRGGPGKGSVHSVRSNRVSLAEIAESEPVSLTHEAMDEADRTVLTEDDDDTIRPSANHHQQADEGAIDQIPGTSAFHAMLDGGYQYRPAPEPRRGDAHDRSVENMEIPAEERPVTRGSVNTYEQAHEAFADFDGAYCDPDPFNPDGMDLPGPDEDFLGQQSAPVPMSSRPRMLPPRPTSYFDPGTGQQMLYYPARVPVMLNLPPKLSKKPKAAVRNKRQTKVLDQMAPEVRQSAAWLPDPLEGHAASPFSGSDSTFSPFSPGEPSPMCGAGSNPEGESERSSNEPPLEQDALSPPLPLPPPAVQPRRRSPRRSIDPEARKSRLTNMEGLPPQLRASAFFDMPSTTASPALELKDGSAMATLDSILDASAAAPVSAFTDHVFAGKLGAEVYGTEKKRKTVVGASSAGAAAQAERPVSASGPKKRTSFFGLGGRTQSDDGERRNTITGLSVVAANGIAEDDDDRRARGEGYDGEHALEPNRDEFDALEEDEDYEDGPEAEVYHGPPTTLLAELQLRKQQQKMRTRPINRVYPNGMHSTLLELDAVAEAQRTSRRGKRINLAWEDPVHAQVQAEQEADDEDVPLGVLYAAKAAGHNDILAAAAEVNRPLGLMERREMEDNEPLSQRRARLQGHEPQISVLKRRSMMTLHDPLIMGGGGGAARLSRMPTEGPYPGDVPVMGDVTGPDDEDEEIEGETLADRMRRLRAKDEEENPLPRARPVSGAFSMELLSQFGDLDQDKDKAEKGKTGKGKENVAPPAEEEETLGQRRRRLQAEREAREREMGAAAASAPVFDPSSFGAPVADPPLVRRLSMADVLTSRPKVAADPRAEEERRRAEEEQRYAREHEEKMRAFRAQVPASVAAPNLNRPGGYRSGMYNDGTGGAVGLGMGMGMGPGMGFPPSPALSPNHNATNMGPGGWNRASMALSGYGALSPPVQQPGYNAGTGFVGGAYGGAMGTYGANGVNGAMNRFGAPMQMQTPSGMPMSMPVQVQMQMPPNSGQMDSIERWRQSVMQ